MNANRPVRDLGSLVDFLRFEHDPWGVKDLNSRFMYANNFSHLGIGMTFNIDGILDREIPHPASAEISGHLLQHDENVMTRRKKECIIQTCYNFKKKEHTPYLFEKSPLYNKDGEVQGVIYHGRELYLFEKHDLWRKTDVSVCKFTPPNDLFTKKECLIIYWLLQRLSSKEIAQKLHLSSRTVDNRINILFGKAGVNTRATFIDYCMTAGFANYIPFELVKPFLPLNMD